MNTETLFSTGKDDWETPDDFFARYDARYHFVLDAAADNTNHKCPSWFGPGGIAEDALLAHWLPLLVEGNIWLNPPYSRKLQTAFLKKAIDTAVAYKPMHPVGIDIRSIVCLLPARTDTKNFHELIKPNAVSIEFIKGRLKFKGAKHGAPFPSMVVIF